MHAHRWITKGWLNSGPSEEDEGDRPCFQWYCARCDTIALTFGRYGSRGQVEPTPPPQPDALNCNGLVVDCDEQVVINIMESSPFITLLLSNVIQWHLSGQSIVTHTLSLVVATLALLLGQWRSGGKITYLPR